MDRKQKVILVKFFSVIFITLIAVLVMVNARHLINRSEAMRAMEHLGRSIMEYRKENRAVPSQSYVDSIRENLEGYLRLGVLRYRGRWIDLDSSDDEILAYSEQNYGSFFVESGAIVLRLDGRVQWLEQESFKAELTKQQSQFEIEMQRY